MQKHFIITLSFIAIIGVTTYALRFGHERRDGSQSEVRLKIGKRFEADGIMSCENYLKLHRIIDGTLKSRSISDTDLDWSIALLSSQTKYPSIVHAKVLATFSLVKSWPPSEEQKVFQVTVGILTAPKASNLDKKYCAMVLGLIDDKRSIPYLVPLSASSCDFVAKQSNEALANYGYTVENQSLHSSKHE